MENNHWDYMHTKKGGINVLQNRTTGEVMEVNGKGAIVKRYFPKTKKKDK